MKKNLFNSICFLLFGLLISIQPCKAQNVAINATGFNPDSSAMLDISSTNSGVLIPRMTTAQRNLIAAPANGLQIFNTTAGTLDIYKNSSWQSVSYGGNAGNLVYVSAPGDLPTASGSAITLDANKMYVFSGFVNISPYYLNLNGAGLRGTDPAKDGIMSNVSGAVLRSTDVSVFMENIAVLPASANTKAYDFSDATRTKHCNLFSGCSVVEIGIPSLGVGQVSGFQAITISKNYWNCKDGIKVTGNVGKFTSVLSFIIGINSGGIGIEFLTGLTIDDIDLSNNYFIYTGQTGVKVNAGATIDRGRMTSNMYRGVTTYITGFDSYTPAWSMNQNTFIPDSRSVGSLYMNNNATSTTLSVAGTFYKIRGATTVIKSQRFTTGDNQFTYTGKESITAKIMVVVGAKSPANSTDYSIAMAKNGIVIPIPNGSMAPATNNLSFQLTLVTEVDISTGDYVEVFLRRNNANGSTIPIEELQLLVTD